MKKKENKMCVRMKRGHDLIFYISICYLVLFIPIKKSIPCESVMLFGILHLKDLLFSNSHNTSFSIMSI